VINAAPHHIRDVIRDISEVVADLASAAAGKIVVRTAD